MSHAQAQDAVYSPENVKAAFLYHFGAYIEWPVNARATEPFTIAVLGAPEIARELRQMATGRSVQNRPVQVREITSTNALDDAQILFIGEQASARLSQLIELVRGRPILVVTETENGLESGAMVNFAQVDRRVRFEISLPAAERSRLVLSSRLLAVALSVERSGGILRRDWPLFATTRVALTHAGSFDG